MCNFLHIYSLANSQSTYPFSHRDLFYFINTIFVCTYKNYHLLFVDCRLKNATGEKILAGHTNEFGARPEIISTCEGKVQVALGFGLANAIVVRKSADSSDGCILIDTLESNEGAEQVLQAFKDAGIIGKTMTRYCL